MAGFSGTLGFGLVSIPIKLYNTVGEGYSSGKTHNVHASCLTQLKQPKRCPKCDREVSSDEIISGFEVGKNELVPLTKEDLAQLPLASKRNIAVTEFVKANLVSDLRLIEKIYVIGPGDDKPNTAKAFSLFNWALGDNEEVGISKIAMSTKETLCFIRSGESVPEFAGKGVMILQTCPWVSQIKDLDNAGVSVPLSDKEKNLAKMLIAQNHVEEIDLSKYTDEYETALLDLVERKRSGEDIALPVAAAPKADESFMDALMASLKPV